MAGGIFGLLWVFWMITIWMSGYLAAGRLRTKAERKRQWLSAVVLGALMMVLTCYLWWLAAAIVIAAGFAVMRKAAQGAPLVMAAALALAIVTVVLGTLQNSI